MFMFTRSRGGCCVASIFSWEVGWGGMGWADNFHLHFHTHIHMSRYTPVCSLALPHRCHATNCCTFSCASTHTHAHTHVTLCSCTFSCHFHTDVMLRCCTFSCASTHTHAHTRHAMLLYVLLHFHTDVMLRCCTFSCASTRTHTHVTLCSWDVLLHFHTDVMLRCW